MIHCDIPSLFFIFSLKYKPVIVSTSGIQAEAKKDIENMLKTIDGELRSSWSRDCTLIVVNEIILTVKVVLALVNGIPIVTPDYVKKVLLQIKLHLNLFKILLITIY